MADDPITVETPSCVQCGTRACFRLDKGFPDFCLTQAEKGILDDTVEHYRGDSDEARMARAAAEIEGTYYGRLTRVEEIVAFANRLGAKKIGIASCVGLIEESRAFAKILRAHGLIPYGALCKAGAYDKTTIGIPEELKVSPGRHESLCNPIGQARLLAKAGTELNVVVGLCVGHDSLFYRYSQAPATTLITKDRVLGHNPVAALQTLNFYYARLLSPKEPL